MGVDVVVLAAKTYQPDVPAQSVYEILDFIEAHQAKRGRESGARYLLADNDTSEQIALPEPVYHALVAVVEKLAQGKAVTISPTEPFLTTQQAADILGVSRPTVVRLIDAGELSAERIGNRRRLQLSDVLEYRDKRRERQYAMLAATAVDIEHEDSPAQIVEKVREARKAIAQMNVAKQLCSPLS